MPIKSDMMDLDRDGRHRRSTAGQEHEESKHGQPNEQAHAETSGAGTGRKYGSGAVACDFLEFRGGPRERVHGKHDAGDARYATCRRCILASILHGNVQGIDSLPMAGRTARLSTIVQSALLVAHASHRFSVLSGSSTMPSSRLWHI